MEFNDILQAPTDHGTVPESATNRSISRILVGDDGRSTYHGQTSAFYELQDVRQPTTRKRLPQEWVKKALFAEAAMQSQ